MTPNEINKVQDYLFKIFKTKGLELKARKQKDFSRSLYRRGIHRRGLCR